MLDEASARVAALLKSKGIEPGDRVGLMLPNVPYFPAVYYGILRAGGVVVPMNVLLKAREASFYLEDPGAKLRVRLARLRRGRRAGSLRGRRRVHPRASRASSSSCWPRRSPTARWPTRAGDDTAVILYTSGTTGKPKGAELTHANLLRNCTVVARTLGELSSDDVALGALPLFHSFGQTCTMNAAVALGRDA